MLTTKRPTPTTVLYTVSTRNPTTNLAQRLLLATLNALLRLAATALALTALLYECNQSTFPLPLLRSRYLEALTAHVLAQASVRHTLLPLLETTPRPYRLVLTAVLLYAIMRRFHTTESLLVIRGLGVQTSTSSSSYISTASTRFIPTSSIQDVFIHEAFEGFEVRFYLSIVVEGEEGVVVVFPKILPRRELLEEVWRGARACLYEPKT